eukprot:765104-Hanusia_phi.AAC.11
MVTWSEQIKRLRRELEELALEEIDLDEYDSLTIGNMILTFLEEIPDLLPSDIDFLQAIYHQNESLQVAELKALFRQLPDVSKNIILYVVRFITEFESHKTSSRQSISELLPIFSRSLFKKQISESKSQSKMEIQVVEFMNLVTKFGNELEHGGLRGKQQAGKTGADSSFTSSPPLSVNSPERTPSRSGQDLSDVATQLPLVLDEGSAAIRQLTDANEAVKELLSHLMSKLDDKKDDGMMDELLEIRERLDEVEKQHAHLMQVVEDKLSELTTSKNSQVTASGGAEKG